MPVSNKIGYSGKPKYIFHNCLRFGGVEKTSSRLKLFVPETSFRFRIRQQAYPNNKNIRKIREKYSLLVIHFLNFCYLCSEELIYNNILIFLCLFYFSEPQVKAS